MMLINEKCRNGSILILAILFATTLSVFSLTYFRVARETQAGGYRVEQSDLAKKISQIAYKEAFLQLVNAGKSPKSQLFWFLLGAVSGVETEIKLPFIRQNVGKLLPPGFSCEFRCVAKVVSFVNNGPDGKKYAGKHEGNGIIALKIEATVNNERKRVRPITHKFEIHHDYIVAAMVCGDGQGSKLQKVLLTRKDRLSYDQTTLSGDNATLITSQAAVLPLDRAPENLLFYNVFSLWSHRNLTRDNLSQLQILDEKNKTINISGINHLRGNFEFNGSWQLKGQGVLIADSFKINGGITKADKDDLLLLYARKGKIIIATDEHVEAGLISVNRSYTGTVESTHSLSLAGLIVADRINLNNWSAGTHHITYDANFFSNESSYQMTFSPWVNFRSGSFK